MTTEPMRIAAITMARNDNFFLERWCRYYGAQLGYDHLYIYLDGEEQQIDPQLEELCHVKRWPHRVLSRSAGDKYRIGLLSDLAAELLASGYDRIIGCDADEFLIVDPSLNCSLAEYLTRYPIHSSLSALGLDLGQHLHVEPNPIEPTRSILAQRCYAVLSARYTKNVVLAQPLRWGSGFHRVKGHNFHIAPHLYLLHTGYCDLEMVKQRIHDVNRTDGNWEAHLKRRARTIYHVTERKAHSAKLWFKRARTLQSLFRPIFALNKPWMPTLPKVVQLPESFQTIEI